MNSSTLLKTIESLSNDDQRPFLQEHCATETNSSVPSILSDQDYIFSQSVFYISDIHLDAHIAQNKPCSDLGNQEAKDYVKETARSLFRGSFLKCVVNHENFIVLFAGDIAADFHLSAVFYSEFVSYWRQIEQEECLRLEYEYEKVLPRAREVIRSLKDAISRVDAWKKNNPWSKRTTKPLLTHKKVPEEIKSLLGTIQELKNESAKYSLMEYRLTQYKKALSSFKRPIYSILGNHEFWDFKNVDECVSSYEALFTSLGITFLHNSFSWIGADGTYSIEDLTNPNSSLSTLISENKKSPSFRSTSIIIIGGVGFAANNPDFNAEKGIYRSTLSKKDEIHETAKWIDFYNHALNYAKQLNRPAIILCHNPITDWDCNDTGNENCIYFNGHTHRNTVIHTDETNTHFFCDNQIGYKNNSIHLKLAHIYPRANPFAEFSDGYHEITSHQYQCFYQFINEYISGNRIVEKQIENDEGRLFAVKHSHYYGFFLTSKHGTYICSGGRITKLDTLSDIEYYDNLFIKMVNTYIKLFSPYRIAQEYISSLIKSFGGSGKIHGYIIDIDFYNHIILNPFDGKITYYNSPAFGLVIPYESLAELLTNHNEDLSRSFKAIYGESLSLPTVYHSIAETDRIVEIDIKNSLYTSSNHFNQLQRLFSKKVLRVWNTDFLNDNIMSSH